MRREGQALRALSVAVAAVRAEIGGDTATDPEEIDAALAELCGLIAQLRLARVDADIRRFVAERPGATSNEIALAVHGDRSLVLQRIKALGFRRLLRCETGSQGRRNWYSQKTSAELSTALRPA